MQVECHAFFNQSKLLEFCKERNVAVAAFSPLGSPARPWAAEEETENLLEDPKLKEIAEQHGKSVAQVRCGYSKWWPNRKRHGNDLL